MSRGLARACTWGWPLVAPCIVVSLIVLVTEMAQDDELTRIVTRMLINLVLVVALYIFIGNSGVVSFGHASFMAIGAYTTALLTIPVQQKAFVLPHLPGFLADAELSLLPAAIIGGLVAAAIAVVVGLPIMRLNGLAAGIATFSFLIVVHVVLINWDAVTRGTGSMTGVPIDLTPAKALVAALAAMAGGYLYQRSKLGRRLRASREDEPAALAIGVNVVRERTIAFALSAFFTAIGGALFGHFLGIFSPDDFYLSLTFTVFAMLIVGGVGSLAGAVAGTLTVTAAVEALLRLEQGVDIAGVHISGTTGLQETGLALFLLLVLIFRPAGIMGGREIRWPWRARPSPRVI
jgi:branched-chain amino acid transport system permease protein